MVSATVRGDANVDTYTLTHTFDDPQDGTDPGLWLASIKRTGQDGSPSIDLPPVTFTAAELPNRVDGSTLVPSPAIFNRPRIQRVTTETGGEIDVDYNLPDCSRTSGRMPASAASDTMGCYNVIWSPPGSMTGTTESDWFNHYTVKDITQNDLVAGSRAVVTRYRYADPAWHYDDSELTDASTRTWDDFRGYRKVTTTTGSGQDGPVTESTTTYMQGMDGDAQAGGGTKPVSIHDSLGEDVTDDDWLAGQTLETDTYTQDGGDLTAYTVSRFTGPSTTGTHALTGNLPDLIARYDVTKSTVTTKALKADGTWSTVTKVTTSDPTHQDQVVTVDQTADGQPEQCTRTDYATSSNSQMQQLADQTVTVYGNDACTATPTAGNAVSGERTLYDNLPFGQAGGQGDPTADQVLDHYGSGTPPYVTTTAIGYDSLGRQTSLTDPTATDAQHPAGHTTTMTFTAANAGELPSSVTTKSSAPGTEADWSSTTKYDMGRQLATSSSDVNGNTTLAAYDALGRLTSVQPPGLSQPNRTISYAVNGTAAPSTTTTRTLGTNGVVHSVSTQIVDGLGREVQTQSTPGVSAYHGRLLSDTFYDSHGHDDGPGGDGHEVDGVEGDAVAAGEAQGEQRGAGLHERRARAERADRGLQQRVADQQGRQPPDQGDDDRQRGDRCHQPVLGDRIGEPVRDGLEGPVHQPLHHLRDPPTG